MSERWKTLTTAGNVPEELLDRAVDSGNDDTTTGPLSSDDDRETRTPDLAQVVRSVKDAYLPRNHAARTTRKDSR